MKQATRKDVEYALAYGGEKLWGQPNGRGGYSWRLSGSHRDVDASAVDALRHTGSLLPVPSPRLGYLGFGWGGK